VIQNLRNIAIIAHVDHGKTTLVDKLLQQSGTFAAHQQMGTRVMDSNDLERERGITILAKNTALRWKQGDTEYRINIIDTPGHADFGGEVERVLSMVDSVLLLVDAMDGPMPQTRFVTRKAFAQGLNPIVVINKVDRPGARPSWVLDQTFDLFYKLGANEAQLDFPVVYASALNGYASLDSEVREGDMTPLFDAIIKNVPAPDVDLDGPLQMQVSSLAYSSYVGTIAVGRIKRGRIKPGQIVAVVEGSGKQRSGKILQVLGFHGLDRVEVAEASAGDIVAITGIEAPHISDTFCDPAAPEALPPLSVDEPTVTMSFEVNNSPFAGRDGKFVTSRQIRERLDRELLSNVALRVEDTDSPDKFRVSGRGELHLSILIENMRREGFEMGVSRPQVIIKEVNGEKQEPYEMLTVDVESVNQGTIMEKLGMRRGDLLNMEPDGKGRVRLELYHVFDHYGPIKPGELRGRANGVLISNGMGKTVAYALFNLQDRGRMIVKPGDELYEGMIIGIHTRDNDLVVNPLKGKQLTNVRASGTDEAVALVPPIEMNLERALEFIEDDELVEVTPHFIRVRKRFLKEIDRKRGTRATG